VTKIQILAACSDSHRPERDSRDGVVFGGSHCARNRLPMLAPPRRCAFLFDARRSARDASRAIVFLKARAVTDIPRRVRAPARPPTSRRSAASQLIRESRLTTGSTRRARTSSSGPANMRRRRYYRRAAQRTTSVPERNYLLLHAAPRRILLFFCRAASQRILRRSSVQKPRSSRRAMPRRTASSLLGGEPGSRGRGSAHRLPTRGRRRSASLLGLGHETSL
jgi:hypothetical protein